MYYFLILTKIKIIVLQLKADCIHNQAYYTFFIQRIYFYVTYYFSNEKSKFQIHIKCLFSLD